MTPNDPDEPGAVLLLSLWIPGVDPEDPLDADGTADELVEMINEVREHGPLGPIQVHLIPCPQWLTADTLDRLRGPR